MKRVLGFKIKNKSLLIIYPVTQRSFQTKKQQNQESNNKHICI